MEWRGRNVTVMGLGRHGGGVGAARFAAEAGARVTVTDLARREDLGDSLAELADFAEIRFQFGEHRPDDFLAADVVIANPAVRPDHPLLEQARRRGVVVTSETEIFLKACRGRTIGVTGSNGKSTTAAMIAAIARAAGRRVHLGGNIGGSLLPGVAHIEADDVVVLELSSFQLLALQPGTPLPGIAVVTSFTPNHLDWHTNLAEYRSAKQRLIKWQSPRGLAILATDNAEFDDWRRAAPGRIAAPVADEFVPTLAVPGEHNRRNARLAAAAALELGCEREAIATALATYRGLPHRLEYLGAFAGRHAYNDSQATTPESTMAALATIKRPIWLLVGGKDKGVDFGPLGDAIVKRACGVALFGSARSRLAAALGAPPASLAWMTCETLSEAIAWIWPRMAEGDALVLSPACSSLDQYRDYAERAEDFGRLVRERAGG